MLLFDFRNEHGCLDLMLFIGPGDAEIYRRLLAMAYRNPDFLAVDQETWPSYARIFQRPLLAPEEYVGANELDLKRLIQERWQAFLDSNFPKIDAIVQAEAR
jgi:Leu/Phe-tRNA-protein transferase